MMSEWVPIIVAIITGVFAFLLEWFKRRPPGGQPGPNDKNRRLARHIGLLVFAGSVAVVLLIEFSHHSRSNDRPDEHLPKADILITDIPPYDANGGPSILGHIAGRVSGVNPSDVRVVVYTYTNNWYVQPYVTAPFIGIERDGKWQTNIHLGARYAALLVKSSYVGPPSPTQVLPPVGGDVSACVEVEGKR